MKYTYRILLIVGLIITWSSCKDKWLDAKPDAALVVPNSVKDYQSLLDNTAQVFNTNNSSGLSEVSSGDFYLTDAAFAAAYGTQEKSAYIWAPTNTFYNNETSVDWNNAYKRILTTNVIMDGMEKIKPQGEDVSDWNNVKGSALFYRAFEFYCLSQQFCRHYIAATASTEPGVPLRLEYNVNLTIPRSTLQQTYDQLIDDLKKSSALLTSAPLVKTRPSKQAAFALLSRVYLIMERYDEAKLYADSALHIQSQLINYSSLNAAAAYPLVKFNAETIFFSTFNYGIFYGTGSMVDQELYASYGDNDYRKTVFYTSAGNRVSYKGSYSGSRLLFAGLATDELYLIRAEANVRKGALQAALKDLNNLLINRWRGTYSPLSTNNADQILSTILTERRKELVFRTIRWSDLRRLNRDTRFAVTLKRTVNGQNYQLLPNDSRYVFPIDNKEISLNGTTQIDR
ncbi:MAG: RagB/SusD family nutrient uptake outer membrane protein [Pedobacter sp.]|nr:MAG: RagB/SusD family nutrient uptake outer membrane protein [Pedobacter sp.]